MSGSFAAIAGQLVTEGRSVICETRLCAVMVIRVGCTQSWEWLLPTPSSHSQIRRRVVLHQHSYDRFRLGAVGQTARKMMS